MLSQSGYVQTHASRRTGAVVLVSQLPRARREEASRAVSGQTDVAALRSGGGRARLNGVPACQPAGTPDRQKSAVLSCVPGPVLQVHGTQGTRGH